MAENLDRKDLTAYERSRNMVALAETASEVLAESAKTQPGPNGGRPSKAAVSEGAIAERIGIPRKTLNNATRHVAAIDAYPELEPLPQTEAIQTARALDAMPEPMRANWAALPSRASYRARRTAPPGMAGGAVSLEGRRL